MVTESSPHLFLTCSEDGEVRQWDLRQPSSAYPAPRSRFASRRGGDDESGNVPPPLISYKSYGLDLNSISCSSSQPQYIALGGAHLHCFLHDRRMVGRDLITERGKQSGLSPQPGTSQDDEMGAATRCVRRFAPNEKREMGRRDHGHITACKISDANPNDMIVSWSGDHIYSFDLVKSPDARAAEAQKQQAYEASHIRNQKDRKRKRAKASSSSLAEPPQSSRRLRRVPDDQQEIGQTALRVRYENGETEGIPINTDGQDMTMQSAHDALLTEAQEVSNRVARSLVKLRKTMFDLSTAMRGSVDTIAAEMELRGDLTPYTATFNNALGLCSTLLPQMDEIIRGWSYPLNPDDDEVHLQNTLRRNRQASWRFVQASGCLAKTLGGTLQTLSPTTDDPRLAAFDVIKPAALERQQIGDSSRFCYDFLKAILLWISGGVPAVLKGFKRPPEQSRDSLRFPLGDEDTIHSLPQKLQTYLHSIADGTKPILDVDANRFVREESRAVFKSQKDAVTAFTRALAGFKLESIHGDADPRPATASVASGGSRKQILDRGAAARFWCVKVGRSLLMDAAEGVTYDFVNRAFGGLRLHILPERAVLEQSEGEIDADEEEALVEAVDFVTSSLATGVAEVTSTTMADSSPTTSLHTARVDLAHSTVAGVEMVPPPQVSVEDVYEDHETGVAEDEDEDEDDNDASHPSGSDSETGDEDDDETARVHPLFRRRVGLGNPGERASVNSHVPYWSHTKVYKGHCNSRTVKDVNYYGLNDEYIVSGSDDGHFFIWDRKTTEIVNILEGDGEVVNVVQGHPYEPLIACSGIDSTVKIFGSGAREQEDAAQGIGVANPGGSVHSSLRLGGMRARMARRNDEGNGREEGEGDVTTEGLRSRKAIGRMYTITSQNDVDRRRGAGDAFMTVSSDILEDIFARAWVMSGLQMI